MIANPAVAMRALSRPMMSNEISVTVATATPNTMGNKEKYTSQLCLTPNKILVRNTVNRGMEA